MYAHPLPALLLLLAACTPGDLPDTADPAEAPAQPLPGFGPDAALGPEGLWLDAGNDRLLLATVAWGREDTLVDVGLGAPEDGGCWIDPPGRLRAITCAPALGRAMPGGQERWRRLGTGAQQAWILEEAPEGRGPLLLEVAVTGATATPEGDHVRLDLPGGGALRYSGLRAWDETGRPLPAWMGVADETIQIWVEDEGAIWPVHVDPVVSSPTTTLTSTSSDFGIGVSLGDVNGDGYADVAVGARFGTGLYGESFIYHGSSTGLSTTASRSWTSSYYYGKFGEYVELAGDFNADGYKDAAISTFYQEMFQVFKGSSSGASSSATVTITGVYGLGRGLAAADWNNDGYDDLAVGAQEPTMEVYNGSSSGLSTRAYTTAALSLSPAVASAGDVNGDGYQEFIYGIEGSAAYVAMGGSSPPSSTKTLTRSGSTSFGYAVTGGGDFDGDGYDDVVVGDPGYSGGTGRVTVYYGSSSGLSISNYDNLAAPHDGFGATVAWAGDVNGDSYDDLAVSDDYDNSYVYVFHGSATGIESTPVNTLNIGDANFGYDMAGGDDIDNDGLDDLVIGSIGGGVYVYAGCEDADSDGECEDLDCDDHDATINTSASEVCDGVDNDCDGDTDDDDPSVSSASKSTFYRDADSDGYGVSTTTTRACEAPSGYVSDSSDCNDSSSSIHPGATETVGDGTDSDCDSRETCYADVDNDGYRTTSTVSSSDSDCLDSGEALSSDPTGDCDDSAASVHPGATETVGDAVDSDCDGLETCYADDDDDGYRTSSTVSSSDSDCSDPGEARSSETSGDCDDGDSAINPAASEVCDGEDNDCDGLTDLADPSNDDSTAATYYADADADGYGDDAASLESCELPTGYVSTGGDCDDRAAAVHPGATETVGDGTDSDCDGAETCYVDGDNDGYRTTSTVASSDSDCADSGEALSTEPSDDCDDADAAINPGTTEIAGDGIDSDCDGTETCYTDADADGYRTSSTVSSSDSDCSDAGEALSSLSSGDCDDGDDAINPDAAEVCDGADNDCDGLTDLADPSNDDSTAATYYADADGDGYGDDASSLESCELPAGYSVLSGDCDDGETSTYPGAADAVADGVDSDCDGIEVCYQDLDRDGYRTDTTVSATDDCSAAGEALSSDPGDDCDDTDADIYPGAPDPAYDGVDQDCSGGDSLDQDQDGHDATEAGGDDCDDTDADIYPGAADAWYDGVDSDCGGEDDFDADADGQAAEIVGGDDCDDADPSVYDGAPDAWYDGVDSDCAGDDDFDADLDGHDAAEGGGADCDDADPTVYPDAPELADGKDNDCDGHDETWDGDGDGLTDLDEGALGTDPADPDTDGDRLGDGEEIGLGTNPLAADSDGGGLDDAEEVGRGSDPLDPTDDDLPISFVKGGGCACASEGDAPAGLGWLFALAPLALLRRARRSEQT